MDRVNVEVRVGTVDFRLELCRKCETEGPLKGVRQYWIDKKHLTLESNRKVRRTIIDLFWNVCDLDGDRNRRDNQEVYIQSRLNKIRGSAAQKILADAIITKKGYGQKANKELINDLDQSIKTVLKISAKTVDDSKFEAKLVEFRNNTANALGFPNELSEKVLEEYRGFESKLFDDLAELIQRDPEEAVTLAQKRWAKWLTSFVRRRGHEERKFAIDIMSYECKTAFFRCYATAWELLIQQLQIDEGLTPQETRMATLWHREHSMPSEHPEANFHLFHGHIFGLHPATALMMQTQSGQQILAEYLNAAEGVEWRRTFCRLLEAWNTSMWTYNVGRSDDLAKRRYDRKHFSPKPGLLEENLVYEQLLDEDSPDSGAAR